MGIEKHWKVKLAFTPALSPSKLQTIVTYLGDSDYSVCCENWYELPVKKRHHAHMRTYSEPAMHEAFQKALRDADPTKPVASIGWFNERCGGPGFYQANDVGKLLRILRKLGVSANGEISGEGFEWTGDILFVKDSHLHKPNVTIVAGPRAYVDTYPSSEDERLRLPPKKKKMKRVTPVETKPPHSKYTLSQLVAAAAANTDSEGRPCLTVQMLREMGLPTPELREA